MESIDNIFLKDKNIIQTIMDSIPHFSYIVNYKYQLVYANKLGINLLKDLKTKLEKKLELGKEITLLDYLNDYEITFVNGQAIMEENFPIFIAIREKKEIKEIPLIAKRRNGENIYLSLSVVPLKLEDEVEGALVNLRDITKEYIYIKTIEEDKEKLLQVSEEVRNKFKVIENLRKKELNYIKYLNIVINNVSEGIVVFDIYSKLKLCNKAAQKIVDINITELVNTKGALCIYDIYILNKDRKIEVKLENINTSYNRKVNDLILKLKNKQNNSIKYLQYNSNPILDEEGSITYTIATIKDITDLIKHEIIAKERADFIKYVVDSVELPLAVLEYPDLTYTLINEKYEELVEKVYSKKVKGTLSGNTVNNIFNKDEFKEQLKVLKSMEKGDIKEHTFLPKKVILESGEERFYKVVYIYHESGDKKRVHISGSDVTEELKNNIELENINRLKDEFFTIISHELRTPLTIIYSSLQLAYGVYSNDITPNIDKILKMINQNSARLLKLTNNVLDISKAEAGFITLNNEIFDIVEETENIVNSVINYANLKHIKLIFDTNEEEVQVCIDKDKYERILLNLLSNAIKFTPEHKFVYINLKIYKENFKLIVQDEGIGIPKDKIDFIFDRFANINNSLSRNAEGTGIGLALVKKIISFMEGQITVYSIENKGSIFMVKLKKNAKQFINSNNSSNNKTIIHSSISNKIDIEFSDIN